MKLINRGMNKHENSEFIEYLAGIIGLGSAEKIGEYSDKFAL